MANVRTQRVDDKKVQGEKTAPADDVVKTPVNGDTVTGDGTGKALEPIKSGEVSTDVMDMMADREGVGYEDTTSDDYLIPFVTLLQKGSPQVEPGHAKYLEKAKMGMFLESATSMLFEQIEFIPCFYERKFTEWVPREQGGGFKGRHDVNSPIVGGAKRDEEDGKLRLENGHTLSDTRYWFGLLRTNIGWRKAVVAMTSTQLKKSRAWMNRQDAIRLRRKDGSLFLPPIYAHTWTFGSALESNNKGSWYGYKLIGEPTLVTDKKLFLEAEEFRRTCVEGKATASEDEPGEAEKQIPF